MGKVAKRFLIGACISIFVGLIFFIGAAISGGITEVKEYVESGNSIGISSVDLEQWDKTKKETISVSDMDKANLTLNLSGGEFTIVETDGSDIVVLSRKKIEISHDGADIAIRTPTSHEIFSFMGNSQQEVTIEVPKGFCFEDVVMEVGAGNMNCPALNCGSLTMEIGAGRMELDRFSCKEADISVGAGEVVVGEGDVCEMDIEVGMGNLVFGGFVKEDLVVDCGMGNVEMELEGKEEDYNYEIEVGMGNVTVGSHSYAGVNAEQEMDNNASGNFDLKCGMGNLEIRFTE